MAKNSEKRFQAARGGQFLTKGQADKHPTTTVGENKGGGSSLGTYRSAKSGEFLTASASKHSKTMPRETGERSSGGDVLRSAKSGELVSIARPQPEVQKMPLEQIEKSIAALDDDELKKLAAWFDELRWERWDHQFEEDVKAGRLDKFIAEAKADIAAGKTRPL